MQAGGIYYLLFIMDGNRKDPGKTPFTSSQDISLGYTFLRQEKKFLVPGKAGQFILQQIQQPKMALKQ